jgi:hypothetical protein
VICRMRKPRLGEFEEVKRSDFRHPSLQGGEAKNTQKIKICE